ncbi:MAG: WD40 repeat domain-containing protein [Methanomassiliicoccales archaeon]
MLGWIYLEQGNVESFKKVMHKVTDERLLALWESGKHPVMKEIRTFSTPNPKRISFIPGSLSISANGAFGLSTSSDRKKVYIWDLRTGARLLTLDFQTVVRSASLSPSGQFFLTGEVEGTVTLWKTTTGQPLSRLIGHRWDVTSVVFSANERYALTASLDGEIKVWDLQTSSVIQRLSGLERRSAPHIALMNFERGTGLKHITSVEFSPSGQHVAASSQDTIYIWEISRNQPVRQLVHPKQVNTFKFLPDGAHILSAYEHSIDLWDVESGLMRQTWTGTTLNDIDHVFVSEDGRYAITTAPLEATRVWDLITRREICQLKRFSQAMLSKDGHWLFVDCSDDNTEKFGVWMISVPENWKFGQGYPYVSRAQQTEQTLRSQRYISEIIKVSCDLIDAKEFHQAYTHLREAQHLAEYARDKRLLDLLAMCGSRGRRTRIRDAWCARVIESQAHFVDVFYHDNKYCILSKTYEEDRAHLWDLERGQEIYVLKESGRSDKCSISTDAGIVAFPDRRSLILWDLRTYRQSRFESKSVGKWEAITLSRTGTRALSLQRERRAVILDALAGKELQCFQEDVWEIASSAVHLGNRYIICGTKDGSLQIRSSKTGQIIRVLTGHTRAVSCITLSSDEKWLLSGSLDHTVRLWDVESGRELQRFIGHRWLVTSVTFSPNEKYVLSSGGAFDSTVRLWDIATGREVRCLRGHREIVEYVAFSNSGRYALSGGSDKTVRLWDLQEGIEIGRLEGHTDAVTSVAFSPDDRYALSCGRDKAVRLWDLKTKKQQAELSTENRTDFVEFTKDGKSAIVIAGCELLIWDLRRKRITSSWEVQDVSIAAISRDQDRVVALTRDVGDAVLCLWDLEAKQILSKINIEKSITGELTALSPDERYGILGHHGGIHLWNLETQREIARLEMGWVTDCHFSHDGRFVILADKEAACIWDVNKKQNIARFEHSSNVRSIALTPDNRFLIAGCNDGHIYIWDVAVKKEKTILEGHADAVVSLSISPEGRYLVSCSDDRTIRVWALDWDYDFPDPADWDEGARPYLDIFLTLHTPYGPDGLSRVGAPQWTEEDFQKLLTELGYRGYGWLRPEGVRRELEKMARERL